MSHEKIEFYLKEILKPCLKKYEVSDQFTEEILLDVGVQLYSLIKNWNDKFFRNALLEIGLEEATYYTPKSNIQTKCLVVVAIRNSLIEVIQSCDFHKAGLSKSLDDFVVKEITSNAIIYFGKLNLGMLSTELEYYSGEDRYRIITSRYPVAWASLLSIGESKSPIISYTKKQFMVPFSIPQLSNHNAQKMDTINRVVLDGISPDFDGQMMDLLSNLDTGGIDNCIMTSFKMCSRNLEKLLKVMEFTLTRKKSFVTFNYYIENGYAEKRHPLIHPQSNRKHMGENFCQLKGVQSKHREVLKSLIQSI